MTTFKTARNYKQRYEIEKLIKVYEDLRKNLYMKIDSLEDEELWDELDEIIDETIFKIISNLKTLDFALMFPKVKNEWFKNFVDSFENNKYINISKKTRQYF